MKRSRLPDERDVDPREIEQRSFEFGLAIMDLTKHVDPGCPAYVLDRLVSEGVSIGAQVAEARATNSRRSHLNGMTAARHASQRVQYWLRLLAESGVADKDEVNELLLHARALRTTLGALCAEAQKRTEAE